MPEVSDVWRQAASLREAPPTRLRNCVEYSNIRAHGTSACSRDKQSPTEWRHIWYYKCSI